MATTINGILCDEIVDGYSETFDMQSGTLGAKRYMCAWTDRYTVAAGLLGAGSAAVRNGAVTLYATKRHPEITYAFCRSVDIRGVGTPSQGGVQLAFPKAIVTANYGNVPWLGGMNIDNSNQLYAQQNIKSSVDFVTLPGRAIKFSSGQLVGGDYAFRFVTVELQITFYMLPYIPTEALLYGGTINSSTFLGCAAGKLMFNGCDTSYSQYASSTANANQTATYSFTFRPVARWDYGLNPDTGAWEAMTTVTGSNPILTTQDFSAILPVVNVVG